MIFHKNFLYENSWQRLFSSRWGRQRRRRQGAKFVDEVKKMKIEFSLRVLATVSISTSFVNGIFM